MSLRPAHIINQYRRTLWFPFPHTHTRCAAVTPQCPKLHVRCYSCYWPPLPHSCCQPYVALLLLLEPRLAEVVVLLLHACTHTVILAHPIGSPPRRPQCCAHCMDLMSTPSCTISHRGLISRSLFTCATVMATARSTSCGCTGIRKRRGARVLRRRCYCAC